MFHKVFILSFVAILLSISGVAAAKSCKSYRSCAEVIADYPDGRFGRKDRDKDGIPCENVCRSIKQVKRLLNSQTGSNDSTRKN